MNYPSNPGVGETVIVFGLKGQYIVFAIVAIIAFIIIAAVLANMSIPILLVILILVIAATTVLGGIIKINKRFGRHGLMKVLALRKLPRYVSNSVEIHHIVIRK